MTTKKATGEGLQGTLLTTALGDVLIDQSLPPTVIVVQDQGEG